MVPAKGVERWLTQRLSHRLGAGAARRRRRLRRGAVPQPAVAGLDAARPRARRRVGPRPAGLAAARGDRRQPRRAVVRRPRRPPRPRRLEGDEALLRRNRRYSVARRLAGLFASYAVQRPQLVTDWREGRDTDGAGARARRRPALAGRAVAPAGRAGRRAGARRPPRRDARAPARGRRGPRPARPAVAVRPHPAPGHRGRAAAGAGRAPRRPPLAAAAVAAAVGRPGRRRRPVGAARRRRLRRAGRSTRCSPRSAATPASCSRTLGAVVAGDQRRSTPPTTPAPTTPARLAPGRPPRQPAPRRRHPRPRASTTPTTGPSRCTPATARPARSTCCARCWSGCSQDDPTLEPRDILVMCPDIETYAPLISAGVRAGRRRRRGRATRPTGCGSGWPTGRSASTNPLLAVAATLVELAGGRVTATEVLDLAGADAGAAPVRLHRRRPRPGSPRWVDRRRHPLGPRRRAPRRVRHERLRAQHLARRARPDPARRRDERRRPPPPRPRPAARRRRQRRHRPGRPARRAGRPARRAASTRWRRRGRRAATG